MTCLDCRAILDQLDGEDKLAKVQALPCAPGACELCPGAGSPGIVRDDEIIHVVVTGPKDIQDGHLAAHVGVQVDRNGQSALRDAASDDEFRQTFSELGINPDGSMRYFYGVVSFGAAAARHDGNERLMCIYDTPLAGKPHHVDIMAPKPLSRSQAYKRLKLLKDKIGTNLTTAQLFRNGSLAAFAGHIAPQQAP